MGRVCPGNNESAGKRFSGRTRKADVWLQGALVEAAWAAARTKDTYLAAQFWRLAGRIGNKKAAMAVAHSILVIAYHLMADPAATYTDLGPDWFSRRNTNARRKRLVKQLTELGYQVDSAPQHDHPLTGGYATAPGVSPAVPSCPWTDPGPSFTSQGLSPSPSCPDTPRPTGAHLLSGDK